MSPLPADPELRADAIVRHMLAHDAFSRWLGVEILELKPARVTLRMAVRQDMTNGFGVCHGGVTFAFADSALAFASNTGGQVTVSIENSMTYPAAVRVGDVLLAEAEQEASSRQSGILPGASHPGGRRRGRPLPRHGVPDRPGARRGARWE